MGCGGWGEPSEETAQLWDLTRSLTHSRALGGRQVYLASEVGPESRQGSAGSQGPRRHHMPGPHVGRAGQEQVWRVPSSVPSS